MIDLNEFKTELKFARYLFNSYLALEEDGNRVATFWYPCKGEVRFLEVLRSEHSIGEAWPVKFGPTQDVPLKSQLLLIGVDDYEDLKNGEFILPSDWVNGVQLYPKCPNGWLDIELYFHFKYLEVDMNFFLNKLLLYP